MRIDKNHVKSLVGKHVYIITRQGKMVDGILDSVKNDKIYLRPDQKQAQTAAFFSPFAPLALFDLLAIGTSPFFFGGPFFI